VIDGYPGLYRDVLTYLRERIKEVLTGAGATVVVRIFGPDQVELRAAAERVRAKVAGIPGVADLKVEQQVLVPQIEIHPRAADLATFGLTAGEVRRQAQTLVAGQKLGEIYRDQKSFDVALWGEPAVRGDMQALRDLMILSPAGAPVRLRDVADVRIVPAPNEVKRENGQRRIDVTLNVAGCRSRPGGARRRSGGRRCALRQPAITPRCSANMQRSRNRASNCWTTGLLCLIGILLLVWTVFRSLAITALLAVSLPFALVGGVIAVALTGGVLSLGSLVGFVTVIGISARNGIMLLSHYDHLRRVEGEAFGPR
jgi:Cu/Ag efflux pump CusA